MKKVLIGFVLLFFLLPISVSATTYYVDKNSIGGTCSDSNPGTITQPWCTIKKANSMLQEGDTVYIRGGIYQDSDQNSVIYPRNSGSSGKYITYTPYNNEEVICNGTWAGAKLYGVSYIKIDGIKFSQPDQTGPMYLGVDLRNADYCIVQNSLVKNMIFPGSWQGIKFDADCSYCQILNNTVDYVGYEWTPEYDNPGDCIWIEGDHHIVTGNILDHCGHSGIYLKCDKSVIKNNIMHGSWCRGMDIGLRPEWTTYRNVVEDNIFYETRKYRQGRPQKHIQHTSAHNTIFRRNVMWDAWGSVIQIYGGPDEQTRKIKIYHNTAYMSGTEQVTDWDYALNVVENTDGTITECDYRNNIFYNNSNDGIHYYLYADPEDHYLTNNHWDADGDPKFVDEANRDFRLQSNSPCIDNGTWLAATASSGSGTQIPVSDAGYFTDGWGIVDGDVIQLEDQTQTARITGIDYANNIITLNTPLTWNSGQGVSLTYNGESPDIGAYEYDSGLPPPNCTGTCRPKPCDTYDDCTNGSGTCLPGQFCCSGIACIACGDTYCDPGEDCFSCWGDCPCVLPEICCSGACSLPACFNESDCGTDPCKDYVCNNPGDCSASCSSQDKTSCEGGDGCCPPGCDDVGDEDCVALEGPVALYHFDEGEGNIAGDSSGYGNDGTINGANWTSDGVSGHALEFDGLNDFVGMGDVLDIGTGSQTIALWFKTPDVSTRQGIVHKGGTVDNKYTYMFELYLSKLHYTLYNTALGEYLWAISVDNPQDNQWHYAVGVYDSVSDVAHVYLDGNQSTDDTTSGTKQTDTANPLIIGKRWQDTNYFNGTIDEVKIYNRTLTQEEILNLYNNPGGEQIPGDLNNDGYVDILDLGIIAANFGKTSGYDPEADVVPNGEIDVFDLVFVASRFT